MGGLTPYPILILKHLTHFDLGAGVLKNPPLKLVWDCFRTTLGTLVAHLELVRLLALVTIAD